MFFDDPIGDRQPKPGSFADRLGGEEGVKYLTQFIFGDSCTIITDDNADLFRIKTGLDADLVHLFTCLCDVALPVDNDLIQLRRNAVNQGEFGVIFLDCSFVLALVPADVQG